MSYLAFLGDLILKNHSTGPVIHHGRLGVIGPFPPIVRQLIHDYGFILIVPGKYFDSKLAWVAYGRTCEV